MGATKNYCDAYLLISPLADDVIRNHLTGVDPTDRYRREYVIGVYPMLLDETCWFVAVDFDEETWQEDSKVYLETCETFNVPAVLERSRSGNGGQRLSWSDPVRLKSEIMLDRSCHNVVWNTYSSAFLYLSLT